MNNNNTYRNGNVTNTNNIKGNRIVKTMMNEMQHGNTQNMELMRNNDTHMCHVDYTDFLITPCAFTMRAITLIMTIPTCHIIYTTVMMITACLRVCTTCCPMNIY